MATGDRKGRPYAGYERKRSFIGWILLGLSRYVLLKRICRLAKT